MASDFESRLRALEGRWEELAEQLSAPDAYQDLDRVQRLSQEQARLREVVEVGRNWRAAQTAAREAQEMSHDSDGEMRALAEGEEHTQRAAEEAAMEPLRVLLLPSDPNDDRDVVVEIRAGTGGDEA